MEANEATASETHVMDCPLCGAKLPEGARACTKCDWVEGYRRREAVAGGNPRDIIAVALSVIPGAGHMYKGHKAMGWLILAGSVVVCFFMTVIATFTAGFGLLLLPLYWLWVMTLAYWVEDRAAAPKAMA